MKEGNQLTLEQALYATLLASANEVAYAVGENVGTASGHDYTWFIEEMNRVCKELGGENSNFVNTNGLHDPNHYTLRQRHGADRPGAVQVSGIFYNCPDAPSIQSRHPGPRKSMYSSSTIRC